MTHYQMESRPWTFRDDADLSMAKDRGASVDEIARWLGRSPASVQYRWRLFVFDIDSLRGGIPRRAGTPWTEDLDWRLFVEYIDGGSITELGHLFGRSPGAIKSRLRLISVRQGGPGAIRLSEMRKHNATNA